MTVSSATNRKLYAGNDSTTAFPTTFKFTQNADIQAVLTTIAGVESTLVEITHYTLTGAGVEAGGTVTMITPPATGEELTLVREVSITQATDYVANDPFPAEVHEAALDKLTMIDQEQEEKISRSLSVPVSDTAPALEFPTAANRASKFAVFDSSGNITTSTGTGADAGLRADLASTAVGSGASLVSFESGATVEDLASSGTGLAIYSNDLATAVAAIGAAEVSLHINAPPETLTANVTVPSNIHLVWAKASAVSLGTYTLKIEGGLEAGPYQLFNISVGIVDLVGSNVSEIHPLWWGFSIAAEEVAINKAIQSTQVGGDAELYGGTIKLAKHKYTLAAAVVMGRYTALKGSSSIQSQLYQPTAGLNAVETTNGWFHTFEDIGIFGAAGSGAGVKINRGYYMFFNRCQISGNGGGGIVVDDPTEPGGYLSVTDCDIRDNVGTHIDIPGPTSSGGGWNVCTITRTFMGTYGAARTATGMIFSGTALNVTGCTFQGLLDGLVVTEPFLYSGMVTGNYFEVIDRRAITMQDTTGIATNGLTIKGNHFSLSETDIAIYAATGSTLRDCEVGKNYYLGSDTVLTGSINPTASTALVGVSTLFTTELVVGDHILVSGEDREVSVITDNLNLTVTAAFTDTANDTSPERIGILMDFSGVTTLSGCELFQTSTYFGTLRFPAGVLHQYTVTHGNRKYNNPFLSGGRAITGTTTFIAGDPPVHVMISSGGVHAYNPSGTFLAGMDITIVNIGGANALTFDSAGLAASVAAGAKETFHYTGTAWV